ncbi:MAG: M20 family metallopeptidase [Bacteroidales bacterium]|nr:M20 family metallopeptidase [Bacteroidales bacterium]
MENIEYFKKSAYAIKSEVVKIMQHLHMYPELSFQEFETKKYICRVLDEWKIRYVKDIGNTNSVVAILEGNAKGKNIGLRAEIDALPISEETKLPYKSKQKGIMHACGHDVHTALLLGALYILKNLEKKINGNIYAIFQPAEEKLPGGAINILKDKFFEKLSLDAVLAYHVYPYLPAGKIGLHCGNYLASSDEIYITVKGEGGHAANPHLVGDTVLASANILITLNQLINRLSNPINPSIISFGKIIANGATNIIPDKVYMEGTFRTFDEKFRTKFLKHLHSTVTNICSNFNCSCEITIKNGYPVLINNPELYNVVKKLSSKFLGELNIVDVEKRTTSEDFAYFSQKYKSLFIRLGTGGTKDTEYPLHSPNFKVNEKIFDFAHGLLAYIALSLLNEKWEDLLQ